MDNVGVGNYIRIKLKEKGITQEALAERLNITPSAVSQNLSGKSSFEIQNLVIIAEMINDTLDNIVRAGERKETELEKAVKSGLPAVLEYEKKSVSLIEKDINGSNAMDYAISHVAVDVLKHLVDNRLYGEGIFSDPLFIAFLIKNDLEGYLTRSYIDSQTSLSTEKGFTWTKIQYPSFFKDKEQLFNLIDKGESITGKISDKGKTLIEAIFGCKNDAILRLLPYFHQRTYEKLGEEILILLAVAIEKDDLPIFNKIKEISKFTVDDRLLA